MKRPLKYILFMMIIVNMSISCTESNFQDEKMVLPDNLIADNTEGNDTTNSTGKDSLNSYKSDSITGNTTNNTPSEESIISVYKDSLIIAHWNIGHFANGRYFDTNITSENYSEKRSQYISIIDSLKTDIFAVCEYNPNFDRDGNLARDAIFYMYNYASIGPKYTYNCNAIFTKDIPLEKEKFTEFCNHAQSRYMQSAEIRVNDNNIIVIETHLDFNQGENGAEYRKSQIQELINITKDYECAIICADYNIASISEYNAFKDAGFTLANCGDFGRFNTASAAKPSSPIDNIIVKGLKISNVETYALPNLSDHCILKCTLFFIKDSI